LCFLIIPPEELAMTGARRSLLVVGILAAGAAWALPVGKTAAQGGAEANLAAVATATTSNVSGDTTLEALNNGDEPQSSRDNRRRSYGNWPARGTQWVEYEWPFAIATNKIDVYWWDDQQGVRAPAACRLLWWDGEAFAPVESTEGLGVARNQFNTTTFNEVRTKRLRLEIDGDDQYSTGILEWKVYDSGKSPPFPPRVAAGVDRVVVLGGKTYLTGAAQTLKGPAARVSWSKAAGPGDVQFADAKAAETTATFTAPGRYELQFTAQEGDLSAWSTLKVNVVPAPAGDPLRPLEARRYRITSPLWNERIKALIVNWIPHCYERMSDPDLREGGINNFEEAAKKLAGGPAARHRGYVFSNAWVHNTVEAMCLALMIDPQGDVEIIAAQAAMREKLADWIPKILASQEPDGYMQTAFTLSGNSRWTRRGDHEGYVAGYFLEAAIAHYLMTDRQDARLYDAARRLADCWCEHLGPPPKRSWYDGHQEMEQALARFGRFVNAEEGGGAGDKYLALAKFLLDQRKGGSEYDQSHLPVVQQYEAVGHAVRAAYSYSGMADVALATGDLDYLSAVQSLWDNIVNKKYYVTGGVGSGETSEGFGPNYSLRNNAYCESCSSCGELFFQHKLNLIYRDASYADLCEETLYNALLGSIDLEGQNFYYQNPLDSRQPRYPWHGCPCCVGNIPRTLLMLPTWMYASGEDGLYVNQYLGSETTVEDVADVAVEVVQETNYPWDGKVTITVNPAGSTRFTVHLRAPNRDVSELYRGAPEADGIVRLAVNGEAVEPRIERGYAVIDRTWSAGDRIELELPMRPQRVRASDQIEAARGRVALRFGPLVYNIESVDQPVDGALDAHAELMTEWRPGLLEGVVVITGKFADGSPMTAVPNFARNNRIPQVRRRPPLEGAGDGGGDASWNDAAAGEFRRGNSRSIVWIEEAAE
jgi:DUF1680 family protein